MLRDSGLYAIGSIPWGTHFCQFYHTRDDLTDILVPYFEAGLKSNEFCMWVTSEPLTVEESKESMRRAVPDFDKKYLSSGQIEIIPYNEWYVKDGTSFDQKRVLDGWLQKIGEAKSRGYEGLRLSGNTFWLEKEKEKDVWRNFSDYESVVNSVIGKYRMIALCTYSLDKCGAAEILDVVNTHQFALIKHEGEWRVIESPEFREIKLTLQESEERYRRIVETIEGGICTVDAANKPNYINKRGADMLGYTVKEMLGRSPLDFVFPEDVHVMTAAMASQTQGQPGERLQSDLRLRRKDNSELWVHYVATPILDEKGEYQGGLAAYTDITERKQAEAELRKARDELELRVQERTEELKKVNTALETDIVERMRMERSLRESEEQYRRLIDTAQEGIWVVDAEGKTTFANQRMTDMLGYTGEELVGRPALDLLDADAKAKAEKRWRKGIDNLKIVSDVHFHRKDGSGLWALVSTSLLFDEKGRFTGVLGMLTDITERKRAEAQIQEQAALLDKAQDAVAVRDLENCLTYWNKGAERMYGWTAEEVMGRNADDLLYKEPSRPVEAEKSVLEKGEWIGELQQVTRDGRAITVESHWTLVRDNDEGKPESILIINTDITEKKLLEKQLRHSQRMESIGLLTDGIAHNLNNALSPVMISLVLLREEVKDDEGQKMIDLLERSVERGANLVKQVQSFSLGVEGEHKVLQAADILSEVEAIAKQTFPRNIEIRTDTAKNLSTILGDSTQLHQVLMNLCLNARDAMMPDGGLLTVSAENFYIDEDYARMHIDAKVGHYILITVSDTGTGIPPEIQDRMFEPFFTTKPFGKGTGLGLSTALGIVKSHGGFINVYSEVGKGSAFKIYLPAIIIIHNNNNDGDAEPQNAVVEKEEEEAEEELEIPAGHGETVLVVEDEASIREITKSTLEKYGYKAITANDGAEAIAAYTQKNKGEEVKVIFMDLMMPSMDGEASIKALRKINPKVKIIAVSGLVEKARLTNIANKVQALLPKPYTTRKLLTTIHKTLNSD